MKNEKRDNSVTVRGGSTVICHDKMLVLSRERDGYKLLRAHTKVGFARNNALLK